MSSHIAARGRRSIIALAIIVPAAIFCIWVAMALIGAKLHPPLPERGLYGDSFGFSSSLFNAMALAGVIFAIYLQKKELELQRQELQETRLELRRSAEAEELSRLALERQVELMQETAILNAKSTLLDLYTRQADHRGARGDPRPTPGSEERRDILEEDIRDYLEEKGLLVLPREE